MQRDYITTYRREVISLNDTVERIKYRSKKDNKKDSHTVDAFARSAATAGSTVSLPEENLLL